jgi:S-DNA-T family DNA segregation ATPase FtsK/SpoIIIE
MSEAKQTRNTKTEMKDQNSLPRLNEKRGSGLLENAADYWLRMDRFIGDISGVVLILFSVITLLGLFNLTKGTLINPWVILLRQWLGWGSYLFVIVLGWFGVLIITRCLEKDRKFPLLRVVAIEGFIFSMLAILSASGGYSLSRAEKGLDGGFIGWGLAEFFGQFLPSSISTIVIVLITLVFFIYGFQLHNVIILLYENWLEGADEALAAFDTDEALNTGVGVSETEPLDSNLAGEVLVDEPEEIKRSEILPALSLLAKEENTKPDERVILDIAKEIEVTLDDFGVPAKVIGYRVGPTVTQYAVEPGYIERVASDGEISRQKIRVSQISNLSKDLALSLSAHRLRIEAPVPGQSYVGIEVPNPNSALVRLRPIMESDDYQKINDSLGLPLGRDVSGKPIVAPLERMPHLLIAGTTGSGKSVCIAALTLGLVMNYTPDELRLAMLDPKMVELVRFNGLPHLLGKVETQPERMLAVLTWGLHEMDRRYRLLEETRSRDIRLYNAKMRRLKKETLPRIVIFIDELADLMMTTPEQTEHSLVRLAQLARATGIHLIVATQRPSTDVVTGLIKANFPARISFTVASSIDSRVILDTTGAEQLLGRGDMLFLSPEAGVPVRAQGVMVSDDEVRNVIEYWQVKWQDRDQRVPWETMVQTEEDEEDRLIQQAIDLVRDSQHASASMLQRRLRVGYPRAARLIDELEEMGVVGPSLGGGREREVLIKPESESQTDSENEFDEDFLDEVE